MIVTERPLQVPCQWCGNPVEQSPKGRLRRYCDHACRQRAYEARTAARRLGADVDTGRVRTQPAERIVERVVPAKHPRTAIGWEQALDELRAQLTDGRIGPWHAQRLQRAIAGLDTQLRTIAAGWPPPRRVPRQVVPEPPYPDVPDVDERLAALIGQQIAAAGGILSTTLQRLAAVLGMGVDELRQAVLDLEYADRLVAYRHDQAVSLDEVAVHARVELSTTS